MLTFSFDHFNPDYFESLAVALAQEHIAAGLLPYGMGRDGGREATYRGLMDYPTQGDRWDGYLVVQAKYKRERSEDKRDEAKWAIQQLNSEMKEYEAGTRAMPEYYLFMTNAALTPYPKKGGLDQFNAALDGWVDKLDGLRAAHVWHVDMLNTQLLRAPKVAGRFGLLHGGDVLHYVAEEAAGDQRMTERTLALYLEKELQADQAVRLAQAGHDSEEPTLLPKVFVDLLARPAGAAKDVEVVATVQAEIDRLLDPESVRRAQQVDAESPEPRGGTRQGRYAVIGGPGSGKTTLTQHVVQRHRAALLARNDVVLSGPALRAVEAVRAEADEAGSGLPAHPRVPFRVVLDQFADALASGAVGSVLDFVAARVAARTGRTFSGHDVERVLESGATLVAFDGLDEVPATSNRDAVMEAVRDFMDIARLAKADLAVIATTRPQGYDAEFSPERFEHLMLQPLSTEKALAYGRRFAAVRYASDDDRRDKVISRLEGAAGEPATARLMTSPLQVTIMAALVDLVGNPPRERYALFDRYYDIVYQREQERGLGASEVLAEHRPDIDAIHDTVGLLLQIETEGDRQTGTTAGGSSGRLSTDQLRAVVVHRLEAEGYEGEALNALADSLLTVALDRLVFIVPREDARYGFEVRSLQEFAAARALVSGRYKTAGPDDPINPYESVKKRLAAVSPAPYWRNVVLFAVGKAFTEREDLRDLVMTVCEDLDDHGPHAESLPGARLALDILEDGIADRKPAYYKKLFARAAGLLTLPDVQTAMRVGGVYLDACHGAADGALERADVLGAVAFLARLEQDDVRWAGQALAHTWPQDDGASRALYDWLKKELVWTPQRIAHAEALSLRSDPAWVVSLGDLLPADSWVRSSKGFAYGPAEHRVQFLDDGQAVLKRQAAHFSYGLLTVPESPAALERVAEAAPTHPAWRQLVAGLHWVQNPTPTGLALALEAMADVAESTGETSYPSAALGWQLTSAASGADPATLRDLAVRARSGELGGVEDWVQAEERWRDHGVSPSDWLCVTDDTWPYSASIGREGFAPLRMITTSEDSSGATRRRFLKAIDITTSHQAKKHLANGFWFHVSLNAEGGVAAPLATDVALSLASIDKTWVSAHAAASVVAPLASPDTAEDIDRLGRLTRFDTFAMGGLDTSSLIQMLVPLAEPGRDGIVRLIAGLSLQGDAPAPVLDLAFEDLGEGGQEGLLLIELLSHTDDPAATVDRIAALLATSTDAPALFRRLFSKRDTITTAPAIAPLLVHDERFPVSIREAAAGLVADLAQRVDSGLASETLRAEVGLVLPII